MTSIVEFVVTDNHQTDKNEAIKMVLCVMEYLPKVMKELFKQAWVEKFCHLDEDDENKYSRRNATTSDEEFFNKEFRKLLVYGDPVFVNYSNPVKLKSGDKSNNNNGLEITPLNKDQEMNFLKSNLKDIEDALLLENTIPFCPVDLQVALLKYPKIKLKTNSKFILSSENIPNNLKFATQEIKTAGEKVKNKGPKEKGPIHTMTKLLIPEMVTKHLQFEGEGNHLPTST